MKYTDSEVWTMIADTLEMCGEMPPWERGKPAGCLCAVLEFLWHDGIVDVEQLDRMETQLYTLRPRPYRRSGYFWPFGSVAPRIAACRELARRGK